MKIVTISVTLIAICSCIAADVAAETIFFDDFGVETASFADGRPVRWGSGASGRVREEAGSLLLTPTPGLAFYSGFVPGVPHTDISIRTRLRMSDRSIQNAGVTAREPDKVQGNWYMALLQSNGLLQIHSVIDYQGTMLAEVSVPDVDPVASDVNMQFDLFGDMLSVTVWPELGLRPSAPQLVVQDAMIPDGQSVGVWMQGGLSDSSTAYRFFEAVPEPSAVCLTIVGFGMLVSRRASLHVCA